MKSEVKELLGDEERNLSDDINRRKKGNTLGGVPEGCISQPRRKDKSRRK